MKKLERLQTTIMYLKQKGRLTAEELAEHLEVSKRTIYRDIDALSQMGIPIIAYEGVYGGYEIDESYFMPSVKLSEREVFILMLILKISGQLNIPDFNESINVLNLKLINTYNELTPKYKDVLHRVSFDLQNIFPENYLEGSYEKILEAFAKYQRLIIKYYSPLKNKTVDREISPFHMFYCDGVWYLDAYCHLRKKKRTFRLDRILDISLLPNKIDTIREKQYNESILNDSKIIIEFEINKDLYNLIKYDTAMIDAKIVSEDDLNYNISIETNRLVYFETLAIRNSDQVTILQPQTIINNLQKKIYNLMEKYC